jgi:hypothetical protein
VDDLRQFVCKPRLAGAVHSVDADPSRTAHSDLLGDLGE